MVSLERAPGAAYRPTCRSAMECPDGRPMPEQAMRRASEWPDRCHSRHDHQQMLHARGTTRTGEYPPPPQASHLQPVTVSASSRSAK